MAVYLRGNWYRYKKQIGKRVYHRALKLKRGQESLLSARLRQVEDEIAALHFGLPLPPSGHSTYLSDAVDQYMATKRDLGSYAQYRHQFNVMLQILGNKPLNFYLKQNWNKLEDSLFGRKLTPATVDQYIGNLRAVFAFAVKKRMMSMNPLVDYEYHVKDSTGRALSVVEIKKVLAGLADIRDHQPRRNSINVMLHDLVLFGLLTGARLSEILNLRHSYIEEDIAWLPITKTKGRKRMRSPGPPRRKPILLSPAALAVIRSQGLSRDDPDFVFPLQTRKASTVSGALFKFRAHLGVPDFHYHLLRHTFASWVATMTDPGTARILLGHSDIQTTMIYAHAEVTAGRAAVAKIGAEISPIITTN